MRSKVVIWRKRVKEEKPLFLMFVFKEFGLFLVINFVLFLDLTVLFC